MDNFDLLGIMLRNQQNQDAQGAGPLMGPSVSQTDPVAQMMFGSPEPSPFSGMGLVNATKTSSKRAPAAEQVPMSQADFLQKQLVAMEAEGIKQQQEGLKAYEEQAKKYMEGQGVNPWQAVAAGLSDFFNGSKNLDKLTQAQAAQKANALGVQEKLQGARSDISKNQTALIKTQLDYEKAKEKNAADEERTRLMFGLAKEKLAAKGPSLTPGQEAADKKFGAEYQDWNQQGGYANVMSNLAGLEDAAAKLEADPTLTGTALERGVPGGASDLVRSRVKPESFAIQQQVYKAVQSSLRQTLGSQFTEKEGEQIMARSFDPRLPAEENARRIRSEAAKIKAQAEQKDAASKYFEQHGTLVGQNSASTRQAPPQGGLTPEQEARRKELLKKKNGG